MKTRPYIVGICGGSGSGKTHLLKLLLAALPDEAVTLISQDNYYLPFAQQKKTAEGLVNFDHPESVRLEELLADLRLIQNGKTLQRQEYTFNNPQAEARTLTLTPAPIIILEGLFIYHLPEMAQQIDLKLFVEAEEHIRLTRRLRRDAKERGYPFEEVLRDYEKFVAPMYQRYVAPARNICDLIIPNHENMDQAVRVLVDHLRTVEGRR